MLTTPPQKKTLIKYAIALLSLCALAVFFVNFSASSQAPYVAIASVASPILFVPPVPLPQSLAPVRLIIPSIGVDAAIERTSIMPDRSLGAPEGPKDTAWFEGGPRPGEEGSAVIDGHYGWKDGIAAVFDDLHDVRVGSSIYVVDDTGATTTFAVTSIRTYGEHDDTSDVFSSSDGGAHLNLITCGGVWNKVARSYSDRLVVFAEKK